ncbi:hypothetical protein PLICRDRAFT_174073 [Plicaturopsis crispa FD-325 SS-3]|nr:hypothetical protein PLICRDRAFT_174073 [Plicaturopsis crispa FD-325 SS-3]
MSRIEVRAVDGDIDIPSLQRQVKVLEAAENDLLKRLREVQHTLASLRSRIGNLVNDRASISRLPVEVLVAIFAYGDPTYTPRSLPSHAVASHVSQHWRQVILCSPVLWTCIWRDRYAEGYPIGLLQAHLEWSCVSPLYIVCGNESDAFFRAVVAHVHRWSSFRVLKNSYGSSYSDVLPHLAGLRAPNLRRLALDFALADFTPQTVLAGGCPVLSSLTSPACMFSEFEAAFAHLTVLHITSIVAIRAAQDVLGRLPSLHTLVLGHIVEFDSADVIPVSVPSLTSLEIRCATRSDDAHYLPQILSAVRVPGLASLILRYCMDEQVASFENWLQSVPSTPFPCLHSLTLEGVAATSVIVRAFPDITDVIVVLSPGLDYCATLETWLEPGAGEDAAPWPLLRSVTFDAPYAFRPCDPSKLVASRIAAGRPLERLHMNRDILPGADTTSWLADSVYFETFS